MNYKFKISFRLTYVIICLLTAQFARPLTVNTQAGRLASAVGNSTDAVELFVTGSLNAVDFSFISDKMTNLRTVDISRCLIEAYEGDALQYTNHIFSGDNVLPDYAFFAIGSLETIVLPVDLVEIGTAAFAGTGLTEVELPSEVRVIGNSAFKDCSKLKSVVTLSAGVARIGARAFEGCVSLENVVLRGRLLTSIGDAAFSGCEALKSIYIPSSVKTIGAKAFQGSGLVSVNVGTCQELSSIGAWAFAKCASLTSVSLSRSVTEIGEGIFFDCSGLSSLVIPSLVTVIPDYSLKGLSGISKFFIPESVDYIGTHAMHGWESADTIAGQNLTSVPMLGDDVWDGIDCSLVTLTVPEDLEQDFRGAGQWREFHITTDKAIDGIKVVESDRLADQGTLTAIVDNGTLILVSTGDPIEDVAIYDVGGKTVYASRESSAEVTVDVSGWLTGVYIVATNVGVIKVLV